MERKVNRNFKGVWIPKELFLAPNLNWQEKILLTEINSLDGEDGCFASNQYFSDFLGLGLNAVSDMIGKLKKLDYIYQELTHSNVRVLKSNLKVIIKQKQPGPKDLEVRPKDLEAVGQKTEGSGPKDLEGLGQNGPSYNISNNTINNTTNNTIEKNVQNLRNAQILEKNKKYQNGKKVEGEPNDGGFEGKGLPNPSSMGGGTSNKNSVDKFAHSIDKFTEDLTLRETLKDLLAHFNDCVDNFSITRWKQNLKELSTLAGNDIPKMQMIAKDCILKGYWSVKLAPVSPWVKEDAKQTAVSEVYKGEFVPGLKV